MDSTPTNTTQETAPNVADGRATRALGWFGWVFGMAGWALAQVFQANGMWKFFGDVMKIQDKMMRGAMFAFIEITALSFVVRAARNRRRSKGFGLDDVAIWGLAVVGGFFSASDTTDVRAGALRFIAPILAAFVIERFINGERPHAGGRAVDLKKPLTWLAVRLGLTSNGQTLEAAGRARRIARVARLAFRFHQLPESATLRRRWAGRRLDRRMAALNETLAIATNPAAVAELGAHLALLYDARTATTAEKVRRFSPWAERAATVDRTPATNVSPKPAANVPPVRSANVPPVRSADVAPKVRPEGAPVAANVPADEGRKVRRTWQETCDLYDQLRAERPGLQEQEYAALLGISRKCLKDARNKRDAIQAEAPGRIRAVPALAG